MPSNDADPYQTVEFQNAIGFLTSAFEAITDGVVSIGVNGRILTHNKKFLEIWGFAEEEILAADEQTILKVIAPLMRNSAEFSMEFCDRPTKPAGVHRSIWELEDGRTLEISKHAQKLNNKIAGWLLSFRDISERKSALDELKNKEQFLRAILESLNDRIVACDAKGVLTLFQEDTPHSSGMSDNMPPTPDKWAERFELYNPDGGLMKTEEVPLYRALHEGKISGSEMVTRDRDGRMLTMLTSGQAIVDENNNTLGAVVVMHDITERKKQENAFRENEYKLRHLLQTMSEGLLQVDHNEVIVFANDRFCEISGYDHQELMGMATVDLLFGNAEKKIIVKANQQRRKGIAGHYELAMKKKNGDMLHVIIGGTPILDGEGNYTGTMGIFTDITERKRAEEQLQHDAFHDSLTGLANRALFTEHLEQAINQNQRGTWYPFAVMFFDFDGFKVVNDSLGHAAGDELLRMIAKRLRSNLRRCDLVARLGGDEFTILLNRLSGEQSAYLLAERIQADLRRPFDIKGREIFTSASIGIAFGSPDSLAADMLRDADIAMYRAKSNGKDRYQVFDKEMHEAATTRLQLETELRQALNRSEFCVYYQPIINLETNELHSFEALIRWNHPRRGLVGPVEFIPAAEENNMILAIGKWTLLESCRQLRQWQKDVPGAENLGISVNLSVKEFLQPDLANQLAQMLKKTKLSPRHLKVEITESHVMENREMAIEMMEKLHSLGVEMSLDDFGTGYSSLSYLHQLPASFLKIDRSFVNRMTESRQNRNTVETVIRLAHNLDMRVVAEGIETAEQLEELKELGCEFGQGYLLSRPMPGHNATAFIERFVNKGPYSRVMQPIEDFAPASQSK